MLRKPRIQLDDFEITSFPTTSEPALPGVDGIGGPGLLIANEGCTGCDSGCGILGYDPGF